MKSSIAFAIWRRIRLLVGAAVICAGLIAVPAASAAGPGSFTQADINASIDKALAFLDTQQNMDGSFGTTDPGAETALALGAYGVKGYANLSSGEQTTVQNGMKYLLGTQGSDGSFNADFLKTYDTGTALIALSLLGDVPTTPAGAIPTAIANGRNYLINNQEITANGVATPCTPGGTSAQGGDFCGGWDYNAAAGDSRSDESNTGFGLTGLDLTGGVPAAVAAANVGWQRNVQQLTSNPGGFPSRNDGGGAYEPGIDTGDFSSNANDTGSLTFGYGYDGVPATDPGAAAAIKLANDVFDVYETTGSKADRVMVFHTGMNEDGACDPTTMGCDWSEGTGEGGYHYSIFALVKGLSQYIAPNLTDPTNYYAKAVDLLLTQQATDGSWPADLRDDGSVIGATGFAVLALGRVGAPADPAIAATGKNVSATAGQSFSPTVATFTDPDTASTAGDYSATIDWGDGHTSTGTITGTGGSFSVNGSHTYAKAGTFTIKVTITDVDNSSNTAIATGTATVTKVTVAKRVRAKLHITDADARATQTGCGVEQAWFAAATNSTCAGTITVAGKINRKARGKVRVKITFNIGSGVETRTGTARIHHGHWKVTITVTGINNENQPIYTISARYKGSKRVKPGHDKKQTKLELEASSGVGPGKP